IIDAISEGGTRNAQNQGHLVQMNMLTDFGRGRTYRELVSHLLLHSGVVPLGLYREAGHGGAQLPYVVTNPSPDAPLTEEDRIYVIVPPQFSQYL
ncbi:hypothetical protein CYMTET_55766, partial [Cymbomonas tetramitiformis]